GVGIDTSRYGHYAAFLRDDLQPAAGELQFVESAAGYAQLRSRLEQIVSKLGTVHFAVRLDVAGQYADNLLHFLHTLQGWRSPSAWGKSHGCGRCPLGICPGCTRRSPKPSNVFSCRPMRRCGAATRQAAMVFGCTVI